MFGYFFLVLPQSGSKLVLASTQQLISLRWIWEKALWFSAISNLVPRFTGRHRPHVSLQTYLYLTPFWVTRKAGSACCDIPSYCTSFSSFFLSPPSPIFYTYCKSVCVFEGPKFSTGPLSLLLKRWPYSWATTWQTAKNFLEKFSKAIPFPFRIPSFLEGEDARKIIEPGRFLE